MNLPPVAVLGASGQVGRFVLPLLAHGGRPVLALGRRGRPDDYPELPGVEWAAGGPIDISRPGAVRSLVSAGPIRLCLDFLGAHPGLERVVVVSSSSVHSKAQSPDAAERSMVADLAQTEQSIRRHCHERGIACAVLRPTLIYGAGMDDNLSRLWRWIERHGWLPLARNARGLRQPLHAADLAEACVRIVCSPDPLDLESPLCGGSTLGFRAMVERLFEAMGRPVRILPMPAAALAALVALASRTGWMRGSNPEMVRRQGMDLVFDDQAIRERLSFQPRVFAPRPADFQCPPPARVLSIYETGRA